MEEEERGRGGEGKEGCALLWLLRLWGLVLLCSAGCCCGYGEGCFSLLVSVPVVGFIEERERGSGGMRMRECAWPARCAARPVGAAQPACAGFRDRRTRPDRQVWFTVHGATPSSPQEAVRTVYRRRFRLRRWRSGKWRQIVYSLLLLTLPEVILAVWCLALATPPCAASTTCTLEAKSIRTMYCSTFLKQCFQGHVVCQQRTPPAPYFIKPFVFSCPFCMTIL